MTDLLALSRLRLTAGAVELRQPTGTELATLAELAGRGVHRREERPFLTPWTDGGPAARARHVLQSYWGELGGWRADRWCLSLAVFHDGRPVGVQDLRARDFAVLREVSSSSWLGLEHQGRGVGTLMRAAVLHLAFAGLDAEHATTMAFTDNPASLAVSRKAGYRDDGISRDVLHGTVVVSRRMRLLRSDWAARDRPAVVMSGVEECRELFGA